MQCKVCNEKGHQPRQCPALYAPLKDGFYSGGGGGHQHDDDCDDKVEMTCVTVGVVTPSICLTAPSAPSLLPLSLVAQC